MAWFKKARKPIAATADKASRVPEGLWVKCPGCAQIIYNKDLTANLNVCPKCAHHFRLSATERLASLFDGGTWTEVGALLEAAVQAAQELKPVLAGTARAAFVLVVVQSLVREFAPPSAQWLRLLLDSPFAAFLIEMAFKRLFPGG